MADKEYVLGNKARELLTYTNKAMKIVTDDVSRPDVRKILQKIAVLDGIRDVKQVCGQIRLPGPEGQAVLYQGGVQLLWRGYAENRKGHRPGHPRSQRENVRR